MANNSNYFPLAGSSMGLGAKDLFTAFGPETQFGTRTFGQGSFDPSKMGELAQALYVANQGKPSQAEEFKTLVPLLKEMSAFQADIANKNAQRKFGQEMLGAGIGALGRGVQTSIAGGSPEMLAYLAQGPVRAAEAYQRGITSMPRQEVPVFAARPTPDRRYFS
jgi:hypothetical protein